MASHTIQIKQRGPGRPKTRDTELVTLNLDKNVLVMLRKLSVEYGMHMNHVIETLVLSSVKDDYSLRVSWE